jgi:hypothetical protein
LRRPAGSAFRILQDRSADGCHQLRKLIFELFDLPPVEGGLSGGFATDGASAPPNRLLDIINSPKFEQHFLFLLFFVGQFR